MPWDQKRHDEVKARCEAATPGPWLMPNSDEPDDPETGLIQVMIPSESAWDQPEGYQRITLGDMEWAESEHMNTAKFIAHARTDLPDALAEIERLQQRLVVTSHKIAEMTYIINGAQTLEEAWKATDD